MAVKGKPSTGYENVILYSDELRDETLLRFRARVALYRSLIHEREENLISMKGLPRNPSQFLENKWIPEDTDLSAIKISRATLYKRVEANKRLLKDVKTLCGRVEKPVIVAKERKASEDQVEKLTIRTQNLAELNAQLEHEYQQKLDELQTRISELLEENERLESILANRSSNVTSLF